MPSQPPKPNTLALSWFYGEHQKGTLILQPKYQRNPIWSKGQQCFLIDSLISFCPIPQVFINIKTEGTGKNKTTIYEVVDGQQRLRAIIEFISDTWTLLKTAAKSYPVSDIYKDHIGEKYSELPNNLQNAIWDYQLAVQEIRGWTDEEIRSMFRRLNYVNERLTAQELRHSQYFGEFNSTAETLAKDSFWDEIDLFSRRDSARMRDVEFVSELLVVVIDGVQDGQKQLDQFYADFDVTFPQKARHVAKFNQVIASLRTIQETITDSRFSKVADFYGLFAAVLELNRSASRPISLIASSTALGELSKELEKPPENLRGIARRYYPTVIEGPNKLAKRKERKEILLSLLQTALH